MQTTGQKMNTNAVLTKNDYIALIIEHLVMIGYSDSDKFVNFITNELPKLSTKDLQAELLCLEDLV
jgi:hypothetical protein